jgi:hypothetical protein
LTALDTMIELNSNLQLLQSVNRLNFIVFIFTFTIITFDHILEYLGSYTTPIW